MTRAQWGVRCSAKNREGQPCGQYAIAGGTVCVTHGGRAPQVKAKAARRFAEAKLRAAANRSKQPTSTFSDPYHVLQRELDHSTATLRYYDDQIARAAEGEKLKLIDTRDAVADRAVRISQILTGGNAKEAALRWVNAQAEILTDVLVAAEERIVQDLFGRPMTQLNREVQQYIGRCIARALRIAAREDPGPDFRAPKLPKPPKRVLQPEPKPVVEPRPAPVARPTVPPPAREQVRDPEPIAAAAGENVTPLQGHRSVERERIASFYERRGRSSRLARR